MDITYKGGTIFNVNQRGHEINVDIPENLGGSDIGMMSSELLTAALGTCMGFYAMRYLKRKDLDTNGLKIYVEHDYAEDPRRVCAIRVKISVPASTPEADLAEIAKFANICLIHNTLLDTPAIELEVVN